MRTYRRSFAVAALIAVCSSAAVRAAETSTDFTVSLTVVSQCAVAATPHDFGTVAGEITAPVLGESALEVVCTAGTPYSIGLSAGSGATASYGSRELTNTSDSSIVTYGLFTDDTRTTVWEEEGGTTVVGLGTGQTEDIPVYGQVPPQPAPSQGTFTDVIVVTVTF